MSIPDVLDVLELDAALVTLDAMGTQKNIAQQIRDRKSDHLLVLKGNHSEAYEAVASYFDTYCFGRGALQRGARSRLVFDAFDESHGRLVRHRVFAYAKAAQLDPLSEWSGLQCVLAVKNIRSVSGKPGVTAQIRYFMCSRPADDETLAEATRRHWSIENGLHWVLDVTFEEDRSRVRERTAARNWTVSPDATQVEAAV